MARPLIVTAQLGAADHAWFDQQRKAHFPPDRNLLPAHLTMFHALPPSLEPEVRGLLKTLVAQRPPAATCTGLIHLGKGVAYRITSPELDAVRDELAARFTGMLTAQDQAGWRAHVTIQNKVNSAEARALYETLSADFQARPVSIHGFALHAYDGGPWITLGTWPFRF